MRQGFAEPEVPIARLPDAPIASLQQIGLLAVSGVY